MVALWQGCFFLPYPFMDLWANVPQAYHRARVIRALESMVGIPDSVYRAAHGPMWTALYEWPHFLVMFGLMPVLMVWFPRYRWEFLRMSALMTVLGCVIWSLWPVAPPWLLLRGGAMPVASGIAQFCSFPSYHVAFAMLVARYLALPGKIYAVAMSATVVFTGNHYLVDVLTGDALFWSCLWFQGIIVTVASPGIRWAQQCLTL